MQNPPLLFWSECAHSYVHLLVLFQCVSIQHWPHFARVVYFLADLLSSLLSYRTVRRNAFLVALHAGVHVMAISQLLTGYPSFFVYAFEMAELRFAHQEAFSVMFYVLGTVQDIATHALNAYFLQRINFHTF